MSIGLFLIYFGVVYIILLLLDTFSIFNIRFRGTSNEGNEENKVKKSYKTAIGYAMVIDIIHALLIILCGIVCTETVLKCLTYVFGYTALFTSASFIDPTQNANFNGLDSMTNYNGSVKLRIGTCLLSSLISYVVTMHLLIPCLTMLIN